MEPRQHLTGGLQVLRKGKPEKRKSCPNFEPYRHLVTVLHELWDCEHYLRVGESRGYVELELIQPKVKLLVVAHTCDRNIGTIVSRFDRLETTCTSYRLKHAVKIMREAPYYNDLEEYIRISEKLAQMDEDWGKKYSYTSKFTLPNKFKFHFSTKS